MARAGLEGKEKGWAAAMAGSEVVGAPVGAAIEGWKGRAEAVIREAAAAAVVGRAKAG